MRVGIGIGKGSSETDLREIRRSGGRPTRLEER